MVFVRLENDETLAVSRRALTGKQKNMLIPRWKNFSLALRWKIFGK